ncbi:L-2,4-diaminobutyric acid acetyltransferase [Actinoalloteichus hoggarensis]|uniref:L-2,4-diaminobutyric acid acetyltransferase n=2 Tax=Actinoalloteichus hoggarensis TaxID=1470176 RepID=A0A221VXN9_9PSEU|nr:L-2,4-diaminobutyric acid acetyltransferase [Actinoalloteichus hoggarensis]
MIEAPTQADGAAMWRIARDSGSLDLNSSYAYVLWGRDFAATSVVARTGDRVGGFVTGYRRPDAPEVLMVWQVAVDAELRGQGLAGRMLSTLVDRVAPAGVRFVETTITADNAASIRLFTGLARDRATTIERRDLFAAELFPAGHAAEDLYRIGPFVAVPPNL